MLDTITIIILIIHIVEHCSHLSGLVPGLIAVEGIDAVPNTSLYFLLLQLMLLLDLLYAAAAVWPVCFCCLMLLLPFEVLLALWTGEKLYERGCIATFSRDYILIFFIPRTTAWIAPAKNREPPHGSFLLRTTGLHTATVSVVFSCK